MGNKIGKKRQAKIDAIYDAVMTKRRKGAKGHETIKREKKNAIQNARSLK